MYAVIFEHKLLYLGRNQARAIDAFRLKNNAELHRMESICELDKLIKQDISLLDSQEIESASGRVNDLFKKLETISFDDFNSEHADKTPNAHPAEVRYLGHKDMKPVCKNFMSTQGIVN
jgi:hypothetical protein